jgi:hypothetical protein
MMSANEIKVYGMSVERIQEEYVNSITAQCCGLEMVVAGILSDVQECVSMSNRPEQVRQQLNIAKYLLTLMARQRREQVA